MKRACRQGTDQQLDTLGHYIPKRVESAVGNGESIMRVGFEGLLVNTGEGDTRHGIQGISLMRGAGGGGRGWGGGGLTIYSCSSLARSYTHSTAFLPLPHQISTVTTVEERSKRRL